MKKHDWLWSVSLITIGVATIILAGSNVIGAALPDAVIRMVGLADLIALPVLAYTTVKRMKKTEGKP